MTHQEGCSSSNREIRVPYYPNNRHSSKRLHVESSPDGLEATKPRRRKVYRMCNTGVKYLDSDMVHEVATFFAIGLSRAWKSSTTCDIGQ